MCEYEWINDPPVARLKTLSEVNDEIGKFEVSLKQVTGDSMQRAQDAIPIAKQCASSAPNESRRIYSYRLGGSPVAMICATKMGFSMEIADVATDPRVRNGMDILVGYALRDMKLKKAFLCAENESAASAYHAIGFEYEMEGAKKGQMTLDCKTSNHWTIGGNGAYRTKYEDFKFASFEGEHEFGEDRVSLRGKPA